MLFSTIHSYFEKWESFSRISKTGKVLGISLLITCLNLNAYSSAQIVTLNSKEVTLQKVFREIYRQTGYQFFYEDALLDKAGKVNLSVKGKTIEETLSQVFMNLPLSYSIKNKTIVVSPLKKAIPVENKDEKKEINMANPIKGKITNAAGEPMIGVNVTTSSSQKGTVTDINGNYLLEVEADDKSLIFSYIGYVTRSVNIDGQTNMDIILLEEPFVLQEVSIVATGYQRLTKERSAGSFSMIKSDDFNVKSNSMNVIDRLEGLVPGLAVNYGRNSEKFLIRGLTSVNASKSPLIVVDGVPIFDGSTLTSLVNPDDIESVTLLRDATAASIGEQLQQMGSLLLQRKKEKHPPHLRKFRLIIMDLFHIGAFLIWIIII